MCIVIMCLFTIQHEVQGKMSLYVVVLLVSTAWKTAVYKPRLDGTVYYTAKALYRKFETNIPRNETARPHSQFLHLCFGERFINFHDWSAYSAAGK
jgi:hypothetical protein